MTLFEDGASHEEEEGWLCRSTGQDNTEPFSTSGTNSLCCCRQGWIMDALVWTQEGRWAAEPGMGGAGCTYQYWGASGDGRSGLLVPAFDDLKEATALN